MRGRLAVRGIPLRVFMGTLPEEKLFPRMVILDAVLEGEHREEPMADYAWVCSRIASLAGESFGLIEELAHRVHSMLSAGCPGKWKVTVAKPFPPVNPPAARAEYSVEG
jgi:dihydroneopterin aldolase